MTELAIRDEQNGFTPEQVATLEHLGVQGAKKADLDVFFNQCKRTGLDPFAKQIYMIERQGKQTIQTGIDGFRLIARRSAKADGVAYSISAPEWCGDDGKWQDFWFSTTPPVAARVTVTRDGEAFPAVALHQEYVARKRDGQPNQMWATRPAGQLAKCAEALALRKAFPADLHQLYTSDEMAQADNQPLEDLGEKPAASAGGSALERLKTKTWGDRLTAADTKDALRALYTEAQAADASAEYLEAITQKAGQINE